jgi:hypothetical protein
MPRALQILILGEPGSGKTSLLGALAEASATQAEILGGRLTETNPSLEDLRCRIYEGEIPSTEQDLVNYPLQFSSPGGNERFDVVLTDTGHKAALDIFSLRKLRTQENAIGNGLFDVDALILAVDSSGPRLENRLRELAEFLHWLEKARGQDACVGGLPVFVALTRCDLLPGLGQGGAGWLDRIGEGKQQARQALGSFLDRPRNRLGAAFGDLALSLETTATKRPPMKGNEGRSREPFGVAELFGRAIASAGSFRRRANHANRRLGWAVTAAVVLLSAFCLSIFALLGQKGSSDSETRRLQAALDSFKSREAQTPSLRLREPLQTHISELADIRHDAAFGRLPQEQKDYLESRLKELREYKAYKDRLLQLPSPESVRTESELKELQANLAKLEPPPQHQSDWDQTEAAILRTQRMEESRILETGLVELRDAYATFSRRGRDLWSFSGREENKPIAWSEWQAQVQKLLTETEALDRRPGDRLPGSARLTYAALFHFESVAAARTTWEGVRQRLKRVSDLSSALGLAGITPGRAPLDIPADFTIPQATARVQELQTTYPRYETEFTLADLPEAIEGDIRKAAKVRYQSLLEPGQAVVLQHLMDFSPGDAESPESWKRLLFWLTKPEDLGSWRVLATVLNRLTRPDGTDPITALEAFLRTERFDLRLAGLGLRLPDDLALRPAGALTVHYRKGTADASSYAFALQGEGRPDPDKRATLYGFQPTEPLAIVYSPGDVLWIDLPVTKAEQPGWRLTWAANRSSVYQFERLNRPPRLHRDSQENVQGEQIPTVYLESSPPGGIPRVPDLLPAMPGRFERK